MTEKFQKSFDRRLFFIFQLKQLSSELNEEISFFIIIMTMIIMQLKVKIIAVLSLKISFLSLLLKLHTQIIFFLHFYNTKDELIMDLILFILHRNIHM